MRMKREDVYKAIDSERNFQDQKWGTIDDHPHEVGGWLTIMRSLLRDADTAWASKGGNIDALQEIRKVVAVGVACLEQYGINQRHRHQFPPVEPVHRPSTMKEHK